MLLDELVKLTERHRLACPLYRDYTDSTFADVAVAGSLADIPYLPVRAFKQFELKSVQDADVYKVMRSSGTSGSYSRIFLTAPRRNARPWRSASALPNISGLGAFPCWSSTARRPLRTDYRSPRGQPGSMDFPCFRAGAALPLMNG